MISLNVLDFLPSHILVHHSSSRAFASLDGLVCPFSHLFTVAKLMPSSRANPSWLNPS
jgi:hypothetical protein